MIRIVSAQIVRTTLEDDVLTAVQSGADAVGFVCYPASPRYVTPSRLMCLLSMVPSSVTKVLVFVNPTSEEVREHLAMFPDCVLQFHGNESRAFCDQFHVPYVKAVSVKQPEDLLRAQDEYPMAVALLADAATPEFGGCGKSFDWEGVGKIRDQIRKPLIVAGGLKEQNVSQAIRVMRPWRWMPPAGLKRPAVSRITTRFKSLSKPYDAAANAKIRFCKHKKAKKLRHHQSPSNSAGFCVFMPSAASLRPERSTFLSFVKRKSARLSNARFRNFSSSASRQRTTPFNRSACNEGER